MATHNISTPAQFTAAVLIAVAGDTIVIAAGTYTDKLQVNQRTFVGDPLTIKAAGTILVYRLECRESTNVVWDFTDDAGGERAVHFNDSAATSDTAMMDMHGSSNVTVKRGHFHGYAGPSYGLGRCFYIIDRNGFFDNITISDNKIEGFYRGIVAWNGSFLNIQRNEMFRQTGDHMQFGYLADFLIEYNYIHTVIGDGPGGVHSDACQFATYNAGIGEIPERGIIQYNTMDVMNGPEYMQMVFMPNEVGDGAQGNPNPQLEGDPAVRYKDITIRYNTIYGLHSHGITIGFSIGTSIYGNTLIRPAFDFATYPDNPNFYPSINASSNYSNENLTIRDNVTPNISVPVAPSGTYINTNNVILDNSGYDANFDQHGKPYGTFVPGPNQWTVIEGSAVDLAQAGDPRMLPGGAPALPTLGAIFNMNVTVGP